MLGKCSTTELPPQPLIFLRQGLAMQTRLASNSQSFCLSLPSSEITTVCHHAELYLCFLLVSHLCVCCVHTWRMKVCGPVRMKRENICSQLLECKWLWWVKALPTQPWSLKPGPWPQRRLSQPAVSVLSQKDLSICFERGRLLFSGQKFGS
jgi:hypothetical protein